MASLVPSPIDIMKANFNDVPQRNIFMSLPKELGLGKMIPIRRHACMARVTTE